MKRNWIFSTLAAVVLLTILVAFINNDNMLNVVKLLVEKDNSSNVSEREMTDNNIDFACKLFRTIYEQKNDSNDYLNNISSIVVSPISVSYMLGMLNSGANGKTRQQIKIVLGMSGSVEQINEYFKKIKDEASDDDTTMTMKIATGIYFNQSKRFRLVSKYEADMLKYYNVQTNSLDFTKPDSCRKYTDNWCKTHTDSMIPNFWCEPNPNDAMYMFNAACFNALWAKEFTRLNNAMPFTKEDGIVLSDIYYMHLKTQAAYGKNDLCEMLRLPYGNGGYCMYVLLPCEDKAISDIISNLSAKNLEEMQSHMVTSEVDILMPPFSVYSNTNLEKALSAMGMPLAFDESNAEFLYMARRHNNLYVSMMEQKVEIKVNEKGIKKVADTIVNMSLNKEPDIKAFHATRPFVYYIVQNSTGTIYFMGTFRGLGGEEPQHHFHIST